MLVSVLMLSSLIISPVWASNIGEAKQEVKNENEAVTTQTQPQINDNQIKTAENEKKVEDSITKSSEDVYAKSVGDTFTDGNFDFKILKDGTVSVSR